MPSIDGDFVLDGEVCCMNPETGAMDYDLVMERLRLTKKNKIHSYSKQRPVTYMVWDILFYNGRDLRQLPLIKRRSILESVLESHPHISIVPQTDGCGEDLWKYVVANHMEGIVGKRKDSKYISKRTHDWQAVVNYQCTDVYVTGYRKDDFGWLACLEEGGKLRSAGIIELGVSAAHRQEFLNRAQKLRTGEDNHYVYLEPRMKARVKFKGRTRGGMLRNPTFVQFLK